MATGVIRAIQVFALAGVLLAPASGGADEVPEDPALQACIDSAVDAVQTRYRTVRDLKARFSQVTQSVALSGGPAPDSLRSTGTVVFAKPGRMRWSYEAPEPSLLVTDGATLWLYDPGQREVQKLALGDSPYLAGAAIQFLLGEGDIRRDFEVSAESCQADGRRLELTPRESASYEKLRIRVDPDSGEIDETTVIDLFGNATTVTFEDLQANLDPPASLFRFEPPPGVQILELGVGQGGD
jgi:outer membrane lipoprotein carrier protein